MVDIHTYQTLNHGIEPSSNALSCGECHAELAEDPAGLRMDLKGSLGYGLKGDEAVVCAQCHDFEENEGFVETHEEHVAEEKINCSRCHNFSRPPRPGADGDGGDDYFDPDQVFADVPPGYWAEDFIHKIYDAGITTGCSQNPLMYCPGSSVTRAQMAVFLLRGIYGGGFTPQPATGVFVDCPASYGTAGWIEEFFAEGITSGCSENPPLYCPDRSVSRAQMAVFLLRSMYGSGYSPPPATGIFDDVPVTHWSAPWIEQLFEERVTGGCSANPPLYCPNSAVTRAQMAVFITRAFGL